MDTAHPILEAKLHEMGFECEHLLLTKLPMLTEIIGDYEGIIIRSKIKIDKSLLDKALKLRFIGRIGSGMESIDTDYAQSKGIVCLNSPEGNRIAVGEHAVGLLLCLLNKIALSDGQLRRGVRIRESNRGTEIYGKTIGIIGYGNMGSAFAKCLSGFNAQVIAYDKYKRNFGCECVREVNIDEVFEKADMLSLHTPLTEETTYMFNDIFIQKMKKPFYLLNTSRGKVVDTSALVNHLKKGKILGAALDVIEYENISFESFEESDLPDAYKFLLASENVVMTPHIAGWTVESKIKMAEVLAEKIKALELIQTSF